MKDEKIYRGDIYLANLNPYKGSEQGGKRPVIIIQNDVGNHYSPTVIVTAVTSRFFKKRALPMMMLQFAAWWSVSQFQTMGELLSLSKVDSGERKLFRFISAKGIYNATICGIMLV